MNENESSSEENTPTEIPISMSSENTTQEAIFSGFLKKKGSKRRTWKKRWFVLRPSRLTYYKNEKEYELLTIIELSNVHSIAAIDHKTRPFCFGVITKQRTYLFQAPNSNLCQHWVSVLTRAHSKCISTKPVTNEKKSTSFHFSNSKLTPPVAFNSLPRSAPYEASPLESAVNFNSNYSPSLATSVLTVPSTVSVLEGTVQGILVNPTCSSTPQLNVSFSLPTNMPLNMATSPVSDGIFSSEDEEEDEEDAIEYVSGPTDEYVPVNLYTPVDIPLNVSVNVSAQSNDHDNRKQEEEEEEEEEIDSPIIPSNHPQLSSIESIQDAVIKQGYIHKQSSKLGKPFRKRWVVLRSSNVLAIYKNSQEYVALDVIHLPTDVVDVLEAEIASKSHPFVFKIVIPEKEILFSVESKQELQDWIRILLTAKA